MDEGAAFVLSFALIQHLPLRLLLLLLIFLSAPFTGKALWRTQALTEFNFPAL